MSQTDRQTDGKWQLEIRHESLSKRFCSTLFSVTLSPTTEAGDQFGIPPNTANIYVIKLSVARAPPSCASTPYAHAPRGVLRAVTFHKRGICAKEGDPPPED